MVTRLENRWAQWEQPLLLLSIILHPKYQLSVFSSNKRRISFNKESYNQFDENIFDFWDIAKGITPELAQLALQLFAICINSASVERLWSAM
ncbi:4217_t:CDS:2, partial [Dentiscutata erythropus]